jgi:hypothetical protein
LRAGRDLEQDPALERLDIDLGAEERLPEGQRELAFEVRAAAGEPRIGQDADDDDEVAATRAALRQLDPCPRVGARRDRDLEPFALDLDEAGRAVKGLGQRDLGMCLVDRRRGYRRPTSTRVATQAHAGQDVVEARTGARS